MVVLEPVQAAVWHALNHYDYHDAIFLAERLYAEVNSDEALFLLATCYYRCGKPIRAYTLLKSTGCPTPQCKYLMARCCLDLNKLSEAEMTLGGSILMKSKTPDEYIAEFGDAASYALALLAQIYSKTDRQGKAADYYQKSLKLNPFMWSSFEKLCHLGEKPDASRVFKVSSSNTVVAHNIYNYSHPVVVISTPQQQQQGQHCPHPQEQQTPAPVPRLLNDVPENVGGLDENFSTPDPPGLGGLVSAPAAPITAKGMRTRPRAGRSILGAAASISPLTPSFGVLPLDTPSPAGLSISTSPFITPLPQPNLDSQGFDLRAPAKKTGALRSQAEPNRPPVFSQSVTCNTNAQTPSPQSGPQNTSQNVPHLRRSSRLFTNSNSNSVKENNKSQGRGKFTSPKGPARRSKTRTTKTQEMNEINKSENKQDCEIQKSATLTLQSQQKQSTDGLMSLLQELGKAYLALAQYDCQRALELFGSLPAHQHQTGWVMAQIGRAHFEMAEYQKAEKMFETMRRVAPHYFHGLEIYSTTLWHLQKDVQLSKLAQELTELDKEAPQSWCAAGNCFSLQREHDTAIKFFQRAVQVEPSFAYAYTLLGHEYVLTEEFDKAMSCFRNAIRVDPRHYNSWYGVGMIFYKQEKFGLAEVHFKKALTINPQSSVLLCHIGVVQHHLQKSDNALVTLNKAIASDPKNPLCKFHKASILFANDKHREALAELEELKQIVPRESLVYFLIGKVHKKLGNTHLALMNFSWAMDLDPKGANNQIKEAIDKRYVTEEELADTSEAVDVGHPAVASGVQDSSMDTDDVQLQAVESDESL
ncbi:cell division cycle protein 27 homolog isoform X2 [Lingula anatina]|uniref:Cell division cycle protein 27 homolog n=1 Tax=Lingula anatina TaxID=7574 RepID=A0A1S3HBY8_LINAN|nr:cell division cycle protein 27 homolog isoform X2 [Lingula anatina]|eukprot:XP_013383510.1 cell division cycle protein 27 homolog isoform X2 [Lingula anatina]